MRSLDDIGQELDSLQQSEPGPDQAAVYLALGEEVLEHWVRARDMEPCRDEREGFRLLALHRQGAEKLPSFNACRETCRELAYHYNLIMQQPGHPDSPQRMRMMGMVARHLYLFVRGKMEVEELGEFCCSSRPVRERVDATQSRQ